MTLGYYWETPDPAVRSCGECAALVRVEGMETHMEWHIRTRAAADSAQRGEGAE